MSTDTVTRLGSSVVQHGAFNDRVYLMKLCPEDSGAIIPAMEALAGQHGYSKLFAKVPDAEKDSFLEAGYRIEAHVPRMFCGDEDGWFLAWYPDQARAQSHDTDRIADVLRVARSRSGGCRECGLPAGFSIAQAGLDDLQALAGLYDEIFETYPFPIHEPSFLREMTENDTRYYIVRSADRVIAAASSEMDLSAENVEMTDFATLPAYRGMGLCSALLSYMEDEMRACGLACSYTIARAAFYPINITFARAGYVFGGTLVNNTNICGAFESMNVWYRSLL